MGKNNNDDNNKMLKINCLYLTFYLTGQPLYTPTPIQFTLYQWILKHDPLLRDKLAPPSSLLCESCYV